MVATAPETVTSGPATPPGAATVMAPTTPLTTASGLAAESPYLSDP